MGVVRDDQPDAREGEAGLDGLAESFRNSAEAG